MSSPKKHPEPPRPSAFAPAGLGLVLLSALAQGCSSARPPRPGSPPPAPQRGAHQGTIDAPAIRAHEARIPEVSPGVPAYTSWSHWMTVDDVDIFYTKFWPLIGAPGGCFFGPPGAAACGLVTLQPRGASPGEPAPAPQDWMILTPGRGGVYALRVSGDVIDWITPGGAVSELATLSEFSRKLYLSDLWAIELPGQTFLLFSGGPLEVSELRRRPGQKASLSEPVELPIQLGDSAQDARRVEAAGKRSMYGDPVLLPLRAAGAWAMVWVEAFAPPFDHPAGKPYRRADKNGCKSGPPSRKLGDRSVDKRLVVTRFEGTRVAGEETLLRSNEIDLATQRVEARAEGDRVTATLVSRGGGAAF